MVQARNWLTKIQLDWKNIFTVTGEQQLDELLHQHNRQAWICERYESKTVHWREFKTEVFWTRTLPLALHDKVSDELDSLYAKGIIVPVKFSSWAVPVVPVIKRDGNVRLCGDLQTDYQQCSKEWKYIPYPELKSYSHQYLVARYFQSWTCRMLTCSSNWMSHLKNL